MGRIVQCKNYLYMGHNKLSCKNPMVTPKPKPKKNMGRLRVQHDVSQWTRGGIRGGIKRGVRGVCATYGVIGGKIGKYFDNQV